MEKELIRDYELDIIVKAWRDENFRLELLKDPKKAIERAFDLSVPHDMTISVHEENDRSLHLIVPSVPPHFMAEDLSDDELKDVIGGVMATGHLAAFPKGKDRQKIRELEKENSHYKKEIEKLTSELKTLKRS